MKEPLTNYSGLYEFDWDKIGKIVSGDNFTAVLLNDGSLGVCANTYGKVQVKSENLKTPDLDNLHHRIIYNAYLNAVLNQKPSRENQGEILGIVDFRIYSSIVMVGYFKNLANDLEKMGIPVSIFDLFEKDDKISGQDLINISLKNSDAVILTASAIANGTFMDIIDNTLGGCDIFLLGPSSIIDKGMFQYQNIKMIFGTVFSGNTEKILEIIKNGGCGKDFLPFAVKVVLKPE
jgi:uncharacterized protein (DUF4213/DUF364 family)